MSDPAMPGQAIERAVLDVLRLRQELRRHDLRPHQVEELMTAAMPAFVSWEADMAVGQDLLGHPPVPEQAATPEQAEAIAAAAYLWAGWQPHHWPVPDATDGRGFRWADPLGTGG